MMLTLILASDGTDGGSIPWLTPTIAVLTLVLGGGGIAALLKVRHDKRIGVAQQEVAEDDALSARWKAIIEAQTVSLLKPMQERIVTLETTTARLETELGTTKRKYWSAISHIRNLYTWIARHLPEDMEQTSIPAPPAALAEDI